MEVRFLVKPIEKDLNYLFDLTDRELARIGAVRMQADSHPGYPCRISLRDAEIGEEVILLPYEHHPSESPYRASGPVFIRKNAEAAQLGENEIPPMLLHRFLSVRAYDSHGMMIACSTLPGKQLAQEVQRLFGITEATYLHVHNAGPGCFNCQIDRVGLMPPV